MIEKGELNYILAKCNCNNNEISRIKILGETIKESFEESIKEEEDKLKRIYDQNRFFYANEI